MNTPKTIALDIAILMLLFFLRNLKIFLLSLEDGFLWFLTDSFLEMKKKIFIQFNVDIKKSCNEITEE